MKKWLLFILLGVGLTARAEICTVTLPQEFSKQLEALNRGECQNEEKTNVLRFEHSMDVYLDKPVLLDAQQIPHHIFAKEGLTVQFLGSPSFGKQSAWAIKGSNVILENVIFRDFPGSALLVEANDVILKNLKVFNNGFNGIVITDANWPDSCSATFPSGHAKNVILENNEIHHNGSAELVSYLCSDVPSGLPESFLCKAHDKSLSEEPLDYAGYGVVVDGYQVVIEKGSIHHNANEGILLNSTSAPYLCRKNETTMNPVEMLHTVLVSETSIYENAISQSKKGIRVFGPAFPRPEKLVATIDEFGDLTVSGSVPLSNDGPWSLGWVSPTHLQIEVFSAKKSEEEQKKSDEEQGKVFLGKAAKVEKNGFFKIGFKKENLPKEVEAVTAIASDKVLGISSSFSEVAVVGGAIDGGEDTPTKEEEPKKEEEPHVPTDPNVDSDNDGLSDSLEVACKTDPTRSNFKKVKVLDPTNPDSDDDGLKDGEEDANHNGWLDFNETDPTIGDTDKDSLSDSLEGNLDNDEDGFVDFDLSRLNNGENCSPPVDKNDLDCDELKNARDDDSDNDSCLDNEEGLKDTNEDEILDAWQASIKSCMVSKAPSTTPSVGGTPSSGTPSESPEVTSTSAEVLPTRGGGFCQLTKQAVHTRTHEGMGWMLLLIVFYWTLIRSVVTSSK